VRIAFLTLFLGLASGRMPVELAVEGRVPGTPAITSIALRLDGKSIGGLTGPPFQGEMDLGKGLLPHHLVARGLDATGVEVASAEQWLNLPQPPATINLEPESGPDGRIGAVRLSFRSITHETPKAVTATLDGAVLPVRQDRVTLPSYKPDQPHLLVIEARYSKELTARRDLAFGGGLNGEVATDLTAALVRSPSPLPAAPALAGWFTAEGQPLVATAVEEEGPAEILVVRDRSAAFVLRTIGIRISHTDDPIRASALLQFEMPLKKGTVVRFVENSASAYSGEGTTSLLFGVSKEFDGGEGGFYMRISRILPQNEKGPPQLADAVAIAGLDALAANHRRAVLLILSDAVGDRSRYDAAAIRRYLAAIRVPLYIWSLRPPPYPAAVAAWGEVEDTSSLAQMRKAYEHLTGDLASQRIVWLDGRHLPQSIALTSAAARGVELVSGPVR
jgi:hypothetical protein